MRNFFEFSNVSEPFDDWNLSKMNTFIKASEGKKKLWSTVGNFKCVPKLKSVTVFCFEEIVRGSFLAEAATIRVKLS